MLAVVNSIINEQEAMLRQIAFLRWYSAKWRAAAELKESDQVDLTQLIQTTYYLKEGLEKLYGKADDLMSPQPGYLWAHDIKQKHRAVVNSLNQIYRKLVDLGYKMLQADKEFLAESIDNLCELVTTLDVQEKKILRSRVRMGAITRQ